ncbi:MAG: mechanosensitive ion channel [Firmicutes bacterium]|nr:mechanosensitive ion channel [Bacillota bacterium]
MTAFSIVQPIQYNYLGLASALFVMIGLYIAYSLFTEILSGYSAEIEKIGKKIRFYCWGFIVSLSVWWFILDLPDSFPYRISVPLVKITWCLSLFFFSIVCLDIIVYFFFDVYYRKVKNIDIPHIISNLIRGIYFIAVILIILAFVLGYDIKPLLTGSAILTAIIGLALQDTLGNFISGLALHLSRPFDLGHWIKVGVLEGSVIKIDWRSTTIKTRAEDLVTIPNSSISKVELINYSMPTRTHGVYLDVGVRYEYPPQLIRETLMKSASETEGVDLSQPIEVQLSGYGPSSVNYILKFFISDFQDLPRIRTAAMEKIWYIFQRNDIEIPFPITDVFIHEKKPLFDTKELTWMLKNIDFLQDLDSGEIQDVINRIKLLKFAENEQIIKQGDSGDTFYIIKQGTVKVTAENDKGETIFTKDMEAGNFFGEISVLTGEPRTASIFSKGSVELLMLNKNDFEYLLKKFPNLAEKISQKIAQRQKFSFEKMATNKHKTSEKDAEEQARKQVESLSRQLLGKIRAFFSIS